MAGLPRARRAKINARTREPHRQVEDLKVLRQIIERAARAGVPKALRILKRAGPIEIDRDFRR
jgi:hypothetical protein